MHFSAYSEQLKQYRDHCDLILNEITEALRYLQDLQKQHLFVSTKTGALHEACEQLLQDQVGDNSKDMRVCTCLRPAS